MKLEEIFIKNPELIEHEEVKKLINHVQEQHKRTYEIAKRYQDFHDSVMDKCMYSEVALINGEKSEDVVKSIFDLMNKMP